MSSVPRGFCFDPDQSNKYARSLIAQRGASAIQALLKKWASDPEHLDVAAAATILWEFLTKEAKVLSKVTLRSQQEKPLAGDVWQVNSERLLWNKASLAIVARLVSGLLPDLPQMPLAHATTATARRSLNSPTKRITMCG